MNDSPYRSPEITNGLSESQISDARFWLAIAINALQNGDIKGQSIDSIGQKFTYIQHDDIIMEVRLSKSETKISFPGKFFSCCEHLNFFDTPLVVNLEDLFSRSAIAVVIIFYIGASAYRKTYALLALVYITAFPVGINMSSTISIPQNLQATLFIWWIFVTTVELVPRSAGPEKHDKGHTAGV